MWVTLTLIFQGHSMSNIMVPSNSNHMSISHRSAVIGTPKCFTCLLLLGWNFGPPTLTLTQGQFFSQNLITSSLSQREASTKNEADFLNTFWDILHTHTHTDAHECHNKSRPAQLAGFNFAWWGFLLCVCLCVSVSMWVSVNKTSQKYSTDQRHFSGSVPCDPETWESKPYRVRVGADGPKFSHDDLWVSEWYQSLTAHQHQTGHTVPKQVLTALWV